MPNAIVQFPEYLPDNCPPETARSASETVYYLVNNDPPTPGDFLSKRQKNPNLRFREDELECQACGISVYTEIKDALNVRQTYTDMANLKIAVGNLTPNLGTIKPTPSRKRRSHHTLWLAIDAQPWTMFKVINVTE